MIVSQITASLVASPSVEVAFGHVALTHTNTCLVFQVKSEERSVERENLMMAYSSLRVL
jgi:hypothetical protein